MKRIFVLLLLPLLLGGCAAGSLQKLETIYSEATTAAVPASTAQIAVSSFEVLEAASTGYFQYCASNRATAACAPGTLANPGPLRLAIKYVRQGRNARDQIKAAGKSGGLISSTVYNLLITAVNNIDTSTPVSTFGAAK